MAFHVRLAKVGVLINDRHFFLARHSPSEKAMGRPWHSRWHLPHTRKNPGRLGIHHVIGSGGGDDKREFSPLRKRQAQWPLVLLTGIRSQQHRNLVPDRSVLETP